MGYYYLAFLFKVTELAINHLISSTYYNYFIRYCDEQGIDINKRALQLKLSKQQDFIVFNDFKILLENIYQNSNTPWLGLDVARSIQISNHGSLGFAVTHGVNLEECLELISRYYQTRLQAMNFKITTKGDSCCLLVSEACDWSPVRQLFYETILLTLLNIIEYIIGNEIQQCSVDFPYHQPNWVDKYNELLSCPFYFGQKQAMIKIPNKLLSFPCLSPNHRTVEFAKNQCDIELANLNQYETLPQRVSYLIETYEFMNVSVDVVSKYLNMSKSTLNRKLKIDHTSYKTILENLRKEHSTRLLTYSKITVENIGYKLGYEDSSNFTRSFKRWFGCTPTHYRNEHSNESK